MPCQSLQANLLCDSEAVIAVPVQHSALEVFMPSSLEHLALRFLLLLVLGGG